MVKFWELDNWANYGSLRSRMIDWRRQTRRQALFFRVIGSSLARVKKCVAGGDVIVSSGNRCSPENSWVCSTQASVMKWSLGSLIFGQGPSSSWNAGLVIHDIKEVESVGQVRKAKRSDKWWRRRCSEWRSRKHREQHWRWYDTWNMCMKWRLWVNVVCDHLNKEKQLKDDDTNNMEERLPKQTSSAVVQSRVHEFLADVLMNYHVFHVILHVVGLVVLCVVRQIHLLSMYQSYSLCTCTWIL